MCEGGESKMICYQMPLRGVVMIQSVTQGVALG